MCYFKDFLNNFLWAGETTAPLTECKDEETLENVIEEQTEPIETPTEIMESNKIVILDCGHAKNTCGKRKQRDDGTYFFEYKSNRDIGRKIACKLEKIGIKYYFVEDLDDPEDKCLSARANSANEICSEYGKENCIFISLHSDACGDGCEWKDSARGWSIYTTKGKTKSDEYATIFFEEAAKLLPNYGMTLRKDCSDGDPDYEENFTVIYKTWCPSVLVEQLFYTSHKDMEFLDSEIGKEVCADIIVNGVKRIFT